jgi:hypothetical protein
LSKDPENNEALLRNAILSKSELPQEIGMTVYDVCMVAELAALAAFYGPHQTCVIHAPRQPAAQFISDTRFTPDKRLLIQRNYDSNSSEIIVFAYDSKHHRYVRTQLTSDGEASSATSPGPAKGLWTWTDTSKSIHGKAIVRHFSKAGNMLHYSQGEVTSECR